MTEMQIKTFKDKSLKEKIQESKKRDRLLNEISNYEAGLLNNKRFSEYYESKIFKLKEELSQLCL